MLLLVAVAATAKAATINTFAMKTQNYVATYVDLPIAGSVTISSQGDIYIGNKKITNSGTVSLPAGRFVLRVNNGSATSIAVTGATIMNTNSTTNVLAASDSYIANYRQGSIAVSGFKPGQVVSLAQSKDAGFSWGGSMHSSEVNNTTIKNRFVALKFDVVVPGDAGMWPANEPSKGQVNMTEANAIAAFAKANGMDAKLHNLVWDSNVPSWVIKTASGLNSALASRVGYWIGNEVNNFQFADIYNELHQHDGSGSSQSVAQIITDAGVKALYKLAHDAAAGKIKVETNNYSVLQYSGDSDSYVTMVKQLAPYVDMAGAQFYVDGNYNLATSMQLLQNIDTIGLPIPLNEFGVQSSVNAAQAPTILNNLMRLMFGNMYGAGFINWYPMVEAGSFAPNSVFYNSSGALTDTGKMWNTMMALYKTQTTATADSHGVITFNGYYGDYTLTAGAKTYNKSFVLGGSGYTVAIPEPSTRSLLVIGLMLPAYALIFGYLRKATRRNGLDS